MSTFLQLCDRTRYECGIGGTITSTIGQTGIFKKIVERTQRAWIDIQSDGKQYKFLRNQMTYTLVPAQRTYVVSAALPTGFGLTTVDDWDKENSYVYLTSTSDESPIVWIDYRDFRTRYRTYASDRPRFACEAPGGQVWFDSTPDQAYTITFDYWMTPEQLVNPTDVPAAPEAFHDMIMWKSVMMFSGGDMATDLYAYAKTNFDPMHMRFLVDQAEVPTKVKSFPLAKGQGRTQPKTFEDAM